VAVTVGSWTRQRKRDGRSTLAAKDTRGVTSAALSTERKDRRRSQVRTTDWEDVYLLAQLYAFRRPESVLADWIRHLVAAFDCSLLPPSRAMVTAALSRGKRGVGNFTFVNKHASRIQISTIQFNVAKCLEAVWLFKMCCCVLRWARPCVALMSSLPQPPTQPITHDSRNTASLRSQSGRVDRMEQYDLPAETRLDSTSVLHPSGAATTTRVECNIRSYVYFSRIEIRFRQNYRLTVKSGRIRHWTSPPRPTREHSLFSPCSPAGVQ